MARTYRDKLNWRRRKAIRNWDPRDYIPGEHFDYNDPLNRYPRLRGGNMVMAPSASGIWSDERFHSGRDRDAQRRRVKRGERQRWEREAALEALPEPLEPEADDMGRLDLYEDFAGDFLDDPYLRW